VAPECPPVLGRVETRPRWAGHTLVAPRRLVGRDLNFLFVNILNGVVYGFLFFAADESSGSSCVRARPVVNLPMLRSMPWAATPSSP